MAYPSDSILPGCQGMTDFLHLLKDDAYAASFQTMGQYRTALITAYRGGHVDTIKRGELASRLDAFAAILDPNKIAGHRSQVAVMREAADAIRALERQLAAYDARDTDAREMAESNGETKS
jgi:hypothetical protein